MVSFWLRQRNAASRLFAAPRAPQIPPSPGHRPHVIPSISTTYPSAPIPYINHFFLSKTSVIKILSSQPLQLGARHVARARFRNFTIDKLTNKYRNWYLLKHVLLTVNWFIVPPKLISELSYVTKAARRRVRWLLQTPHYNYLFK